ncbi:translation initiation factor 2 [Brevundimonas sp.]|uniref:translation initiation factor 2 n=1 Tax=Brevundimonas sp. TaxID=1871086 RepID=UPI002D680461|nr:translation initiation factor 2 [Brevundimonas sp.]HYC97543.1 translation initiation factor 2 [Brevundimonas sp.]
MIFNRNARFAARALTLVGVALSLPACATITRGTTQAFTVESTPPGASVSTSNGFQCDATPCTFRMPRKDAFRATVSMDGYVTQEHEIASGMSGAGGAGFAGNVLVGGLIGMTVDANSGAMKDLTPNPLVVTLRTPAEEAAWRAGEADRQAAAAATAAGAGE